MGSVEAVGLEAVSVKLEGSTEILQLNRGRLQQASMVEGEVGIRTS